MHRALSALVIVGALVMGPAIGLAASESRASTRKAAATATHSTTGVVKSVDAMTLIITREGTQHGEMTFVLEPATQREGAVDVGSHVSVRYRDNGKSHVATAITARQHAGR